MLFPAAGVRGFFMCEILDGKAGKITPRSSARKPDFAHQHPSAVIEMTQATRPFVIV
jgi:hypothetical protein